jgi:hypothetical protein
MASFALLAGCGAGNNETPADFDPAELALVRVEPGDGESSVARNRPVRLTFNTTVLPSSVHDQSLKVRTGGTFQTRPKGAFLISGNIVEFEPTVTDTGGANSSGFPAGAQILVEVPLKILGDGESANNFLQNVEGNPIAFASGDNKITFTTGLGWNDPVPGPPGVLGLEFIPAPNAFGQVPSTASVTVIFSEAVDPGSIFLGKNIFLTNNSETAPIYQQDVPSVTFFDGSLTRFTFVPVFGFGQGPFNILVNFIDPDAPDTFSPNFLPKDLGGNGVQNFTFFSTFDTQFDPSVPNTGLLREDFTTGTMRDPDHTDALWGDDTEIPFALVGQPITTRTEDINIVDKIVGISGGVSAIDNPPSGIGEEDYCPTVNPLLGPDAATIIGNFAPPTSAGRRQLNLYRAGELGTKSTIIRAAWGPDSDATFASTYDNVILRLGHHSRGQDLAGASLFAQFDVDGYVTVVDPVTYTVPQRFDVNGDNTPNNGFLDWPELDTFFEFNGEDDLILDVEAQEGTTYQTFRTYLALTQAFGTCACGLWAGCAANNSIGQRQMDTTWAADIVDPAPSTIAGILNPGPWVHVMQFEMSRLRSDARSFYYDTMVAEPDYMPPIIQPLVQPGGAAVLFTWSASHDGLIEDVPFGVNISDCDDHRYIRYHAVMRANFFTKSRPRIQLIEIPFTFE